MPAAAKNSATKKKKKAYDGHAGVVAKLNSTVRHITLTIKHPRPLCGADTYYYSWSVSTTPKTHALPLCKGCVRMAEKIANLLQSDFGYVDKDTLLEDKKADFIALLAELEEED
jgi:hypothetical protein